MPMSIVPLECGVDALERHAVEVDDWNAVEIFELSPQGDDLQQIGNHLDFDDLAIRVLDQVEHLHVLVERQGDVQLIDPFALEDVRSLGERAEQRQAAIADVIALGAVVDEADDPIAEVAVFEHLVHDGAPELARARDQHPLEADALAPAPLQRLPHGDPATRR